MSLLRQLLGRVGRIPTGRASSLQLGRIIRWTSTGSAPTAQGLIAHTQQGAPTDDFYPALRDAVSSASRLKEVRPLLEDLDKSGIALDAKSYTVLLSHLIEEGDFIGATRLYASLRRRGVRPTSLSKHIPLRPDARDIRTHTFSLC